MLEQLMSYAFLLAYLACGAAMVVRFRGSPGAVLGGIAFGILLATDAMRRLLQAQGVNWWDYNWSFILLDLAAFGCLFAAIFTARVHDRSARAGVEGGREGADPLPGKLSVVQGPPLPVPLSMVLFSFAGRIGRGTFWAIWASMFILNLISSLIFQALAKEEPALGLAVLLWLPVAVWVGLAMQAKRWHDRDKSAWMILINFIPVLGMIWALIELGCLRGTEGPNRYGADPAGGEPGREAVAA